jgi:hypothetical protein
LGAAAAESLGVVYPLETRKAVSMFDNHARLDAAAPLTTGSGIIVAAVRDVASRVEEVRRSIDAA